jgi:hypothetical protein
VTATELVMLAAVRNGVRMSPGDSAGGKEPAEPEALPGEEFEQPAAADETPPAEVSPPPPEAEVNGL